MKSKIKIVLAGCMLITALSASSQTVTIDFIEFQARNIVIHYSLDDGANSSRQFLVQLYSSQDNYTTALTRVSGDYGTEVSPGFDKKMVWDITKELGAFKGDVALEIRGRVYVPFAKIRDISEGQIFKRGRNYPLNWSSGNLSGQVNIELFNAAGERIWGENNVSNVGKFDWFIQSGIKKGKGYRLKFTNAKDRNDVVYSPTITIKPKIPFWAKLVSAGVVGAAIEYFLMMKKTETGATAYGPPPNPN